MTGYAGTPLAKKLGLRDDRRAAVLRAPPSVLEVLRAAAPALEALDAERPEGRDYDYLHLFCTERAALEAALPAFREALHPDGMIWVSWPKRSAKVAGDLDENVVRAIALAHQLVDIKVCAVDATWSGLKLVIPRALRPAPRS